MNFFSTHFFFFLVLLLSPVRSQFPFDKDEKPASSKKMSEIPDLINEEQCLYISRQFDHKVTVYNTIPNPRHPTKLKVEMGTDLVAIKPGRNPTGVTSDGKILYVASYGNSTAEVRSEEEYRYLTLSSIDMYDIQHNLRHLGSFANDENIIGCFPEDITYHEQTIYVGCGVPNVGVLKYDMNGKFLGKMAEGDYLSAIWGVTVHEGYLYFSSYCTGSQSDCDPNKQDKIFRVPLTGGPNDVSVFATMGKNYEQLTIGGFGDIEFGPDGYLYVASGFNRDVLVFNKMGVYLGRLNLEETENPVSIAFHQNLGFTSDANQGLVWAFKLFRAKKDQRKFCVPGPLLNSKINYITWAPCPVQASVEKNKKKATKVKPGTKSEKQVRKEL